MADPQTESRIDDNLHVQNGNYTRVHNRILEELAKRQLSGYETRIIFALWRKTYGWQKKEDSISFKQFQKMTKLPKSEVSRTLSKLKKRNLVVENYNSNKRMYRFNKHFTTWKELEKSTTSCKKLQQQLEKPTTSDVEIYNQKSPRQLKIEEQRVPKETSSKETITKETISTEIEPQLDNLMKLYQKKFPAVRKIWGLGGIIRAREYFEGLIMKEVAIKEIKEAIEKAKSDIPWKIFPDKKIERETSTQRLAREMRERSKHD